jgi:hypothetical protein
MQKLIVLGEPGIRRDAIIDYGGKEMVVFDIDRQGEWHGPEAVQLWCTIGTEDEREIYEKRRYVPHWLDVETIDAAELDVVTAGDELAV